MRYMVTHDFYPTVIESFCWLGKTDKKGANSLEKQSTSFDILFFNFC